MYRKQDLIEFLANFVGNEEMDLSRATTGTEYDGVSQADKLAEFVHEAVKPAPFSASKKVGIEKVSVKIREEFERVVKQLTNWDYAIAAQLVVELIEGNGGYSNFEIDSEGNLEHD